MTARATATGVVVTHAGQALITRTVPAETRSAVVAGVRARLAHVAITGDSAQAWMMRRRMAADALHGAIREVGRVLDTSA